MAYETPLRIAEVVKDIANNQYVLPSIQREYVWSTMQIETLFDSIMQDYPIGAFLFWEISGSKISDFDFYEFLKNYHQRDNSHNQKIDLKGTNNVTAVLDGQQRLTSLYIGLKGTYAEKLPYKKKSNDDAFPAKKLFLNLLTEAKEESNKYDFRFLADSDIDNSSECYWFEVGKILEMEELGMVMEYVTENISYSEDFEYSKEQAKFATNTLSQLFNVIHTSNSISYYREKSEELDKVLNIFIRVNSGGTTLSYSDLLLSIASAQWEKYDARQEITDFVDTINSIGGGFNVNKDFVLKSALVLSDLRNIAFKVDNFNKENMQLIESKWQTIKKAIHMAVRLVSSFGYSRDNLSSNNALIPIAYYLMTINLPDSYVESSKNIADKMLIKKWLISSLLKRAFSGQPDNVLRPIRDIIKENGSTSLFPLDIIIEKFKGTNKSLSFSIDDIDEHLLKLKYGKSETLSSLMILYPSLDYSNKFHVDHMYPKSKMNKKRLIEEGLTSEEIDKYIDLANDISNLQLLPAIPNIEKQDSDYNEWFMSNYKTDEEKKQYRDTHYAPDMEYSFNSFIEFTEKRRKLLRNELVEKLLK